MAKKGKAVLKEEAMFVRLTGKQLAYIKELAEVLGHTKSGALRFIIDSGISAIRMEAVRRLQKLDKK